MKVAEDTSLAGQGHTDARGVFDLELPPGRPVRPPFSAVAEKAGSYALATDE